MAYNLEFNWYPGHIAKAERQLREKISQVDLIIELRDSRIPLSSAHADLLEWAKQKPVITVFTKADLADPNKMPKGIVINSKDKSGFKNLFIEIEKLAKPILEKYQSKGVVNRATKLMIVGYPNIGKSSLINAIAGNKKAKVEDRPGVTRSQQWIDLKSKFPLKLLDTPGIIPSKLYSTEQALKLAMSNAIPEAAYDVTSVARAAIDLIESLYPGAIQAYYRSPKSELEAIALSRNWLLEGQPDLHKAAVKFIEDFRDAKIGKISLD
ncbi:MAG: ribosome biogenesis GTPase YlqF [Candidatus Caenarcaniphilales bacterium]|jgi:ribosome biogenesis GTPase A|nr:ribosome biogenesis GTPase YlqF [Candidatus Caenarcaniphilales bacterium]